MLETSLIKRTILAWGSDPDLQDPRYMSSVHHDDLTPAATMFTGEAIQLLRYQVVAAGVAGLAVGWLLHRPARVQANRRRGSRR